MAEPRSTQQDAAPQHSQPFKKSPSFDRTDRRYTSHQSLRRALQAEIPACPLLFCPQLPRMSIILDCSGGLMQMGLMCDCELARPAVNAALPLPPPASHSDASPHVRPSRPGAHLALGNDQPCLTGASFLLAAGDEEFFQARMEGREPVETAFKPRLANISPRTKDSWAPTRSNTQQPPLTGPVSRQ